MCRAYDGVRKRGNRDESRRFRGVKRENRGGGDASSITREFYDRRNFFSALLMSFTERFFSPGMIFDLQSTGQSRGWIRVDPRGLHRRQDLGTPGAQAVARLSLEPRDHADPGPGGPRHLGGMPAGLSQPALELQQHRGRARLHARTLVR